MNFFENFNLNVFKTDPILAWFVPLFFVIIFLEMWVKKMSNEYNQKDAWASIGMGIGSAFVNLFSKFIAGVLFYFLYKYRFFTIDFTRWYHYLILFLVDDFSFYVFHRACHRIRFFWCGHVNHHSSTYLNFSTAIRQGWGEVFTRYIWWMWIPLIGIHPLYILTQMSLSIVYQFFLHTNYIHKVGILEYVFNTPSHHRVHHGVNEEYLDKNYAGILIIWDRIFGSFIQEKIKPQYGITKNINTYNPFVIASHEYIQLWKDIQSTSSFQNKLKYIFYPPGWSHYENNEILNKVNNIFKYYFLLNLICNKQNLKKTHDSFIQLYAPELTNHKDIEELKTISTKLYHRLITTTPVLIMFTLISRYKLFSNPLLVYFYYKFVVNQSPEKLGVILDECKKLKKTVSFSKMKYFHKLTIDEQKCFLEFLQKSELSFYRRMGILARSYYVIKIYASEFGNKIANPTMNKNLFHFHGSSNTLSIKAPKNLVYNNKTNTLEIDLDYIVIGSGPAGSLIANKLQKNKFNVLLLEKGSFYNPYTRDDRLFAGFSNMDNNKMSHQGSHVFVLGENVGGGTTVNMDLVFPPTLPFIKSKFMEWKNKNIISDDTWNWNDIEFAYGQVKRDLPIRKASINDVNNNNHILRKGAELLNLDYDYYYLSNQYLPNGKIEKFSAVKTYLLPSIQDTENPLMIIPNAKVEKIIMNNNQAKGVQFYITNSPSETIDVLTDYYGISIPTNVLVKVYAKNVISSAGTIGSTEVLLKSNIKNSNIGKGLITHPIFPVIGVFREPVHSLVGDPATIYVPHTANINNDLLNVSFECSIAPISWVALQAPGFHHTIAKYLKKYNYMAGAGVVLFDEKLNQNRIKLNSNNELEIYYELSHRDKNKWIRGISILSELLLKAGASEVLISSNEFSSKEFLITNLTEARALAKNFTLKENATFTSSAHMMGTLPMGNKPSSSVVNGNYEVWNTSNLYVVDSSIFPESIGSNPMMTIYTIAQDFINKTIKKQMTQTC